MIDEKWITMKNKIINDDLVMVNSTPLFSFIELNINNRCTRQCRFCPRIAVPATQGKYLDLSVHNKLLDDLNDLNYEGLIMYSGFSEPLLHAHLEELIANVKKKIPASTFGIVTNGDLLDAKKLQSIFKNGLDILSISLYDGSHQIEHFSKMMNSVDLTNDQVFLRRRYYQDGNNGFIYSNRAGALETNVKLPIKKRCFYPFYTLYIDYNGDVQFCPHDPNKNIILGNVKNSNIFDIWTCDELYRIRRCLSVQNRADILPCSKCDVLGDVMGKINFDNFGI